LGDKYLNVRESAASALGEIGTSAIEPLISALRDEDSNVREEAAEVLDKLGWEPKDEKEKAIYLVAKKKWDDCVKIGIPAVEPLIGVLRDEDWRVREAAASVLGKIGDKRAVEPLIAALRDGDSDVREAAASALGEIGDKKAIPALVLHLRDWYAGDHVADALDELGWQPTTDEEKVHYLAAKRKVDELKQMWDITKRVLFKDIESNDYRVMKNAVHALLSIEKKGIIQELIDILNKKGTKEMAEIYLNCGCPELCKAVESWAFRHGYEIYVSIFEIRDGIIRPARYDLRLKSKACIHE
jgi:uncharacterized membrane-anchored protein YjiN (DUF445 family)